MTRLRSRHLLRRSGQRRCKNPSPPQYLILTDPHASRLTFSSRPSWRGRERPWGSSNDATAAKRPYGARVARTAGDVRS
jgi:hypothetical protein